MMITERIHVHAVCAIEEFLDDLVKGAVDKAESRGSKLLSGAHLCVFICSVFHVDLFCPSCPGNVIIMDVQEGSGDGTTDTGLLQECGGTSC